MRIGEKFNPYRLFVGVYIPNAIVRCKDLSLGAKLCYGRLAQYAGEDGEAYPSYETLAEEIGSNRRSAIRYAKELHLYGLIRIVHRKNLYAEDYTSNVFQFLWHSLLESSLKDKGGDKNALPLVTKTHHPSDNLSPKENNLKESTEIDLNTVENHDRVTSYDNTLKEKETLEVIKLRKSRSTVGHDAEVEAIPADIGIDHLKQKSKRKEKLAQKFKEKNIPALVENWDKERVMIREKIDAGGVKVKTSPRNSNTIVAHYKELFKEIFGGVAPFQGKKDLALAKKMIDHYGYDFALKMLEWTFYNWAVFVREKNIKGVPTIGLIWGFRAYIQSKLTSYSIADTESAW